MDRRRFLSLPLAAYAAAAPAERPGGGTALVLGAGGCRGYAHVGVLKALEHSGITPDLIVGSSVGALVGALYAAGLRAADLERIGQRIKPNIMRDWIFPKLGIFGGSRIRRFVVDAVGARAIENLPLPFAAVATDLRSGETVVMDHGDLALAVQASSSAPGLMAPVKLGERLLVDGNLSSPLPVDTARALGARHVVAIDVSFPPEEANLDDPYDALYQGFSILTRKLAMSERSRADLVIVPPAPRHDVMSPQVIASIIGAGELAATSALPRLRGMLQAS